MGATKEDLGESKVRLHIEVGPEAYEKALDKAYNAKRKDYALPGFRKGKVPRRIIEERFGEDLFDQDATVDAANGALPDAVEETGIQFVGVVEDSFKVLSKSRQDGIQFDVDVYVYPEVELSENDLKGMKATRTVHHVTEELVEDQINEIRNQNIRWVPVERGAELGDTVVIDFVGSMDGVPFDGGSAQDMRVELGKGRMIPGFEEQLVGISADEDRTIDVRFPDEYGHAELAGKEAQFKVHASSVEQKEIPDLDDDFAEDISSYTTMEELREALRKDLQEQMDRSAQMETNSALLEQATARARMDVPPPMVLQKLGEIMERRAQNLARRGIPFDKLLQANGVTQDEYAQSLLPEAMAMVRQDLTIQKLADMWNLRPSDENRDSLLEKAAEEQDLALDELKAKPEQVQEAAISQTAFNEMMARLEQLAEIEEITPEEAQARKLAEQAALAAEKAAEEVPAGTDEETQEADYNAQEKTPGEEDARDGEPADDAPYAEAGPADSVEDAPYAPDDSRKNEE